MASLKTSEHGKILLKQAREAKGWKVDDLELFRAASQILQPSQDWGSVEDVAHFCFSRETLKRFFYGTSAINAQVYKACCLALGINWQEAIASAESLVSVCPVNLEFFAYDQAWVGRETLINQLTEKILSSCRLLLLLGLAGIGKTALAERLVIELEEGNWISLLRANFDYLEKPADFVSVGSKWLEELGEKLSIKEKKPDEILQRLSGYLQQQKVLIIIDSLEMLLRVNENQEWGNFVDPYWENFFLSILSSSSCLSRVIITSQDLPTSIINVRYKNFYHCQILSGLNQSEQVELFTKMGLDNLDEQKILLRISKVYQGHPLVIRVILGEILESFYGNVLAYWHEVGAKITEVETDLSKAQEDISQVMGINDQWQLHKLTRKVYLQVNQNRLQLVFERLSREVKDAFILICAASVYRVPVQAEGWIIQLGNLLRRLEGKTCEQERLFTALEALSDRFLVEVSFTSDKKRLLGMHHLIRSVAIAENKQLISSLKKEVN